jgi:hypothetical protein
MTWLSFIVTIWCPLGRTVNAGTLLFWPLNERLGVVVLMMGCAAPGILVEVAGVVGWI